MDEEEERVVGLFGSVLTKIHCVAHGFRGMGPQPEGCETDGDAVDLCRLESIMP